MDGLKHGIFQWGVVLGLMIVSQKFSLYFTFPTIQLL